MDAEGTRLFLSPMVPKGVKSRSSGGLKNVRTCLASGGLDQSERLGVEEDTLGGSNSFSVIQYDASAAHQFTSE